jgi:hypothetical protein
MHNLVDFLVEERYCNTESEAIKILESVSDEFYDSLVEAEELKGKERIKDIQTRRAPERLAAMRTRLKTLTKSAQENPKSIKPKTVEQINRLRVIIPDQESLSKKEMEKRKKEGTASKGLQKTPTGPKGRRVQKTEEEGINPLNDPRVAAAAERESDEKTGTRGEVPKAGGASNQSTRRLRQTQYSRTSGGRGTNIGRAGGVATGE